MLLRNKVYNKSTNLKNIIYSLSSDDLSIGERIEMVRPLIFDFDYDLPKNKDADEFKREIETMFIDRYIMNYFGVPTYEQFYLRLKSLWKAEMKTYTLSFENLFSTYLENFTNNGYSESITEGTHKDNSVTKATNKTNTIATNETVESKFPQSIINAKNELGKVKYANNGSLTENGSTTNNSNDSTNNQNGESYVHTINKNYKGNAFEDILKYKNALDGLYNSFLDKFLPLFDFMI